MKKSTLLSLATAGAIVATSAFTFAAWDKLDATTQAVTIKMRKPAEVTVATDLATGTATETFNSMPKYEATAKFNVADIPASEEAKYEFTPTVKVMDTTNDVTSDVKITVVDAGSASVNGNHDVTVTIEPKDETDESKALADKNLTVTVKGEVKAK